MPGAEVLHALKLLRGVAVGHIGHGLEAQCRDDPEQLFQVAVLEALRLLVSRHRLGDIPQVGVGADGPDAVGERKDLPHARAFGARLLVEGLHQVALQHPEQVVRVVGVGLVQQELAHLRHQRQPELTLQERDQGASPAAQLNKPVGQGKEDVPFGDGAVLLVMRKGQHVPVEVQGQLRVSEQRVQALHHAPVAPVALGLQWAEVLPDLRDAGVRYPVQGDVGHRELVGIVQPTALQGRAGEVTAAFQPDGGGQPGRPPRRGELLGPAERVMVHDAGGGQAGGRAHPDGLGGRVGGEGVEGVDVVVHILPRGANRRLPARACQPPQGLQPLGGLRVVELGDAFVLFRGGHARHHSTPGPSVDSSRVRR